MPHARMAMTSRRLGATLRAHTSSMTIIAEGFVHRERARFTSELAAASEDRLRAMLLVEVRASSAPFGKAPEPWRLAEALAACRARDLGSWATAQLAAAGLAEPVDPAASTAGDPGAGPDAVVGSDPGAVPDAAVDPDAAIEPEVAIVPDAAA